MSYFARGSGDETAARRYLEMAREVIDAFRSESAKIPGTPICFYIEGVNRYLAIQEKRREIYEVRPPLPKEDLESTCVPEVNSFLSFFYPLFCHTPKFVRSL